MNQEKQKEMTDMSKPENRYQAIKWHRRGRVLTLEMCRPESFNAVDEILHEELSRVFRDADADPHSDVIIFTGNGQAFCAGGDVSWMQRAIDEPETFERTVTEAKQIVFSILDCEKPVICRINGHAMGLGCTMALFCDVTFMNETVKIGDPHVLMGMVAGDGAAVIWPALIGMAKAKEYLMTGDPLTAKEALDLGLINHVCAPDELDDTVNRFADRLANGPVKSIKWTKVSLNIHLKQVAHSVMDACLAYEALTNQSADHQEAVTAFREKRAPIYTGK
tara:strand:- start:33898 stop:34731 length:834 start_codon:yes stop_codon:yes gene_type:complete